MWLTFPTLAHVTKKKFCYPVLLVQPWHQIISLFWVPMSWAGPVHMFLA